MKFSNIEVHWWTCSYCLRHI